MNDVEQKREAVDHFKSWLWIHPVAVTATFKIGTYSNGFYQRTTEWEVMKSCRLFRNNLKRACKVNCKRHIQIISAYETNASGRLHYHFLIDRPPNTSLLTFAAHVRRCWAETGWGARQVDVQRAYSDEWIDYICKFRSKSKWDEAIDWENCYRRE